MTKLLRFLLRVPFIWRYVADYIIRTQHHTAGYCLACLARNRCREEVHSVQMNDRRQLFCKKCGLPITVWKAKPRCKGNGPKPPIGQQKSPSIRIVPIAWGDNDESAD